MLPTVLNWLFMRFSTSISKKKLFKPKEFSSHAYFGWMLQYSYTHHPPPSWIFQRNSPHVLLWDSQKNFKLTILVSTQLMD